MAVEIELSEQPMPGLPRRQSLTLACPMTVQEVTILVGLKLEKVGLVTIGGVQKEMEDPVPRDCRLCYFPYLFGG